MGKIYRHAVFLSSEAATRYACDMFGFTKFILFMAVVAAGAYFTFYVPMGDKTLSGHVKAISQTPEAVALSAEIEKKAADARAEVLEQVPEVSVRSPSNKDNTADAPEQAADATEKSAAKTSQKKAPSNVSAEDKQALVKLLKQKSQ